MKEIELYSSEAKKVYLNGYNCAQATLFGLNKSELSNHQVQMIASAFCGGMARSGSVCGAVAGALMGLGLSDGYTLENKLTQQDVCLDKAQLFLSKFKETFGSLNCKDLLDYDLSDSAELKAARDNGIFKTICPKYVEGAVKMMTEIINIPD